MSILDRLWPRRPPVRTADPSAIRAFFNEAAADVEHYPSTIDPRILHVKVVLEHLGDVFFQLRQLDKASDAWRQAAKCAEQAIPPEKRLMGSRARSVSAVHSSAHATRCLSNAEAA